MKGVLLSGGKGTRLRPITHTGPKQLIPVANKPVLQYALEDLREAGITEVGIILGNKGREAIQEFVGDGSEFGLEVTYIVQGEPLGLAHAAGCARDFVGDDDFVMYLGDNILKQGIEGMVNSFRAGNYDAGIALQSVADPTQFGVAELDADGDVISLVEKPDDPPSDLALIGIYVFSPAIFEMIEEIEPSWRGELEITDAIQRLLERGRAINSHVVEGWWKDTGKPKDILDANRLVLEEGNESLSVDGTVEEGAEIRGRVALAESATISGDAVVRGPVSIAAGTYLGEDAYVGPYTSIGPNTTIKNAHIENSVIVGNSQVSASGRIVDSLIGRRTTIESADGLLPKGRRLVLGENSNLKL